MTIFNSQDLPYLRDQFLKATRGAAIELLPWIGRGDKKGADAIAVNAMRNVFGDTDMSASIVIGEGERDEAPMLFIGETVGTKVDVDPYIDIAVDPLEGTNTCAVDGVGAFSVAAFADKGNILHAPDLYMQKLAVDSTIENGVVDLSLSTRENLENLARFKKCDTSDLRLIVLNRTRHQHIIEQAYDLKTRVKIIEDGDISAIISVIMGHADIYLGTGGAPEGVLAASVINSLGGNMQGKLVFNNTVDENRAIKMGIKDFDRIYTSKDLVIGKSMFVATGVTSGDLLKGVKINNDSIETYSVVISNEGTDYIKNITKDNK